MNKKTIALILVITIGSSLFIGLTSAAPGNKDPFSLILSLLGAMDGKLDDIQASVDQTTQILAYYTGFEITQSNGYFHAPNTEIFTSEPVLFTVTVWLSQGVGEGSLNNLGVFAWDIPNMYVERWTDRAAAGHTVTFGGTAMKIVGTLDADCGVYWRITIQGAPGTVITVLS